MEISKILKPKTELEIWESLSRLSPDEMLLSSTRQGFYPGVVGALERGADINAIQLFGTSVLVSTIRNGHINVASYLVKAGANVSYEVLECALPYPDLLETLLDVFNPAHLTIAELRRLFGVAVEHYKYRSARKIKTRLVNEMKYIYQW